jgi:hypothetical protein
VCARHAICTHICMGTEAYYEPFLLHMHMTIRNTPQAVAKALSPRPFLLHMHIIDDT